MALVFENDLSLEVNGGFIPGDILRVQAENSAWLKETTGNRLTLKPEPRAGVLRIQFILIHRTP